MASRRTSSRISTNARDSRDEGYKQGLDTWLQQNTAIRLNIIEKPPGQTGFAVIPKRWVVERAIAWAGRNRLASKEYNRNPESSEAFLYLGSITMLLIRLYPRCYFFDHAPRISLRGMV